MGGAFLDGDSVPDKPLRSADGGGLADGQDRRTKLCAAGLSRKLTLKLFRAGRFDVPLILSIRASSSHDIFSFRTKRFVFNYYRAISKNAQNVNLCSGFVQM